jgi:hypothetical protein
MAKPFSAMFSASAAPIVPNPINPILACCVMANLLHSAYVIDTI